MPQLAHKLIKYRCEQLAGCAYERFASNNKFYKKWPNQKRFIETEWARFIPEVRAILAGLLAKPCPVGLSEFEWHEVQDEIFAALALDASLPRHALKMPKPQKRC